MFYELLKLCFRSNTIFKGALKLDLTADYGVICTFKNFPVYENLFDDYNNTAITAMVERDHTYIIGLEFVPEDDDFSIKIKEI